MAGRRLLIMLGVALIMLIGAGALIFALLFPHAASQQGFLQPATPTPSVPANTGASRILMVTGTVQSLGHQSLVITSRPEKQAITVVVNSETRYAMSNRPASFSNLRAGQTVTIRGQVDPEDPTKILALSILIT